MTVPTTKPDTAEKTEAVARELEESVRRLTAEHPVAIEPPATQGVVKLEGEILDELKRMNRLLYSITYGPRRYTLSFLSGVARGLGAAVGATVIFALFIATLSHFSRTPVIGNYIRHMVEVMHVPQAANGNLFATPSTTAPSPISTPTPSGLSGH